MSHVVRKVIVGKVEELVEDLESNRHHPKESSEVEYNRDCRLLCNLVKWLDYESTVVE